MISHATSVSAASAVMLQNATRSSTPPARRASGSRSDDQGSTGMYADAAEPVAGKMNTANLAQTALKDCHADLLRDG